MLLVNKLYVLIEGEGLITNFGVGAPVVCTSIVFKLTEKLLELNLRTLILPLVRRIILFLHSTSFIQVPFFLCCIGGDISGPRVKRKEVSKLNIFTYLNGEVKNERFTLDLHLLLLLSWVLETIAF